MYDENDNLVDVKYTEELGDIHYNELTIWQNLPELKDIYVKNKQYCNLIYVAKNNSDLVEVKNNDDIDKTLFNGTNEIILYIKYTKVVNFTNNY